MKKWFLHILLLAGLFGTLTTSCSQEDEGLNKVMKEISKEKATVFFTIALDGPSARSRTWGEIDNPQPGEGFENDINFSSDMFEVKMSIVNVDTVTVQNISYWKTDDNVYEFVGEVEIERPSSTYTYTGVKIEVFANIEREQTDFETEYDSYPGRGVEYIPMWGVHTIESLTLTPGERTSLGTIDLLRSMAKIEVVLADNLVDEGYVITDAILNKYNKKGNLLPSGTEDNTVEYGMDACFNPLVSTPINSSGLHFDVASDSTNCVIYVPEYDNAADDLQFQAIICQRSSNNGALTQITGTENFPGFHLMSNTKDKGIVRNHWYRYTITAINVDTDVEGFVLQYKVIDWTEIDNGTLNFGDDKGEVN